ncbi:MAG: hypothetical protein ACYCX4_11950 [Bacillota bacterium]
MYQIQLNSLQQQIQHLQQDLQSINQMANQMRQSEQGNQFALQQLAQAEANATRQLQQIQGMASEASRELQQLASITRQANVVTPTYSTQQAFGGVNQSYQPFAGQSWGTTGISGGYQTGSYGQQNWPGSEFTRQIPTTGVVSGFQNLGQAGAQQGAYSAQNWPGSEWSHNIPTTGFTGIQTGGYQSSTGSMSPSYQMGSFSQF